MYGSASNNKDSLMKKCILSSFFILSLGANGYAAGLKADLKQESYAIGVTTGSHILNQVIRQDKLGVKTDIDRLIQGFGDALRGKSTMDDNETISYLNLRADNLNKLQKAKLEKLKKETLEAGKKYLAEHRIKKGVKTTKSGLQYEVLKEGSGGSVQAESIVMLNYQAKLIDGTVFDDTYKRKAPAHLSMINIIDGLKEGLLLMKEGSKYKLVVPSELAYKEDGVADIPPNAVVIFEVELLKVMSPGEFKKMAHQKADVKIDSNKTKPQSLKK